MTPPSITSCLSIDAKRGIERFCGSDLDELFSATLHSAEHAAWLWFLLRAAEDKPEWFPRGKWATLQRLESIIESAANVALEGRTR